MSKIQLLDTVKSGCKAAVLPIVVQEAAVTFDTATDGTAPTTITPTGTLAPYGGSFLNKGCADITATISYVTGGNCETCDDPDTLTSSDIVWTIPANSITEIPEGFWTEINYVLATAANDDKLQTVSFESAYTPDCPDCSVLLADVE
jgi:hypothetical protein